MSNEVTSSVITELIPVVNAETTFRIANILNLPNLIMQKDISNQPGLVAYFPYTPAGTVATALEENSDLSTNTAFDTGRGTATCSQVGLMFTVTDLATMGSQDNLVNLISDYASNALAAKIESDIIALFDGFSTSKGTTNTNLSLTTFKSAITALEKASAPRPYYAVLSPQAWQDLTDTIQATSSAPANVGVKFPDSLMYSYYVGELLGVPVYISTLFSDDGSGDHKCGMFSKQALGIAWKVRANIEIERDASLRAYQVVATATYGVTEIVDAFGVELLVDGDG